MIFRISSLLVLVLIPCASFAEFSCRSEVQYEWRKKGQESNSEVLWSASEERGESEEAAKKKLDQLLIREKFKANASCRREHENISGCIAGKFTAMSSVLKKLSFTARKALEEAIATDCSAAQGICKKVVSSDPKCEEIVSAKGEEQKAEEVKGKDKKKKKKKKKK